MKNYLVVTRECGEYTVDSVDVLPAGMRVSKYGGATSAYYAVEPYLAHAKPYGLKKDKPVEIVVYGVAGEDLLFKYRDPSKVETYDGYRTDTWDTCRFDQTTEGWRFVRSVVKVMKVLIAVSKKAAVERRKTERNRAAAKAREGREGTCQICEGRQIIQPTGANKATLVLHGYTRPGYGFTVGNCYGYHRKPFEVACDALVEWVDMLKAELARTKQSIAELATLTSMKVEKSWRSKEEIEITPDSDPLRWGQELASRKLRLEYALRSVEREIDYHSKRLANWKPA